MSYGFEIVNLFAVLGTTCLMVALAVVWYAPAIFGKWLPGSQTDTKISDVQGYIQVALSGIALFAALFVIASVVNIVPLIEVTAYQAGAALFLVVAGIRGSEAVRLQHSLRHFLIDCGYYALVIIGGTLLFTHWPS